MGTVKCSQNLGREHWLQRRQRDRGISCDFRLFFHRHMVALSTPTELGLGWGWDIHGTGDSNGKLFLAYLPKSVQGHGPSVDDSVFELQGIRFSSCAVLCCAVLRLTTFPRSRCWSHSTAFESTLHVHLSKCAVLQMLCLSVCFPLGGHSKRSCNCWHGVNSALLGCVDGCWVCPCIFPVCMSVCLSVCLTGRTGRTATAVKQQTTSLLCGLFVLRAGTPPNPCARPTLYGDPLLPVQWHSPLVNVCPQFESKPRTLLLNDGGCRRKHTGAWVTRPIGSHWALVDLPGRLLKGGSTPPPPQTGVLSWW